MSILDQPAINPYLMSSNQYNLEIKNSPRGAYIKMELFTDYYHTNYIPDTVDILENRLPEVLRTKCFNDSGLPFNEEVRNTEIGHLFEHILLEYLCQKKIASGYKSASFRGVTNWNWRKDPKGTFYIKINIKPSDVVFFEYALERSIKLLNRILVKN